MTVQLAQSARPQRSQAAVTEKPGRITMREFDVAGVPAGAVLMRVSLSGVCGTDKHTYRGESKQYAGTPNERDIHYPLICGHENVGTVTETGGDVYATDGTLLRTGDRIVPGANVACGTCFFCKNGYPYYLCSRLDDYGNSLHCEREPYLLGGWAEYMFILPGTPIFRVPDALPDEVAVITEVMAVTHGLEVAQNILGMFGGNRSGGSVAVLGVGPLGLSHIAKAAMLGASTMIATDLFPQRLRLAEEFGVTRSFDASQTTMQERIALTREATDGLGPEIVVDCSGVPSTFVEALRMVRIGGVVIEAGTFVDMGPVSVNPNIDFCTRNVTVIGIGGETAQAYEPAMRAMAARLGRYPFDRIVTHKVPLEDAEQGVITAQRGDSMQVVIDPWADEVTARPLR
jgi:threonine dehydrogenase-like Zn-dependent dehydrogenase